MARPSPPLFPIQQTSTPSNLKCQGSAGAAKRASTLPRLTSKASSKTSSLIRPPPIGAGPEPQTDPERPRGRWASCAPRCTSWRSTTRSRTAGRSPHRARSLNLEVSGLAADLVFGHFFRASVTVDVPKSKSCSPLSSSRQLLLDVLLHRLCTVLQSMRFLLNPIKTI